MTEQDMKIQKLKAAIYEVIRDTQKSIKLVQESAQVQAQKLNMQASAKIKVLEEELSRIESEPTSAN